MVGGDDGALKAAEHLFEYMGSRWVHCGPAGSGLIAKICNNMILGMTMAAVAEAMNLGVKYGRESLLLLLLLWQRGLAAFARLSRTITETNTFCVHVFLRIFLRCFLACRTCFSVFQRFAAYFMIVLACFVDFEKLQLIINCSYFLRRCSLLNKSNRRSIH